MQIDIEEGIPRDLKKILGRKYIFLLCLNEFNLNDGLENYTVANIFYASSNEKKVWKEKKIQTSMLYYFFCYTILM